MGFPEVFVCFFVVLQLHKSTTEIRINKIWVLVMKTFLPWFSLGKYIKEMANLRQQWGSIIVTHE
jgi:hypothetical protein